MVDHDRQVREAGGELRNDIQMAREDARQLEHEASRLEKRDALAAPRNAPAGTLVLAGNAVALEARELRRRAADALAALAAPPGSSSAGR